MDGDNDAKSKQLVSGEDTHSDENAKSSTAQLSDAKPKKKFKNAAERIRFVKSY
eukprot:CAMPEP_0116877830 /NCGR_PEP_ID=MMETSP0463-20121206/9574_1 /TAXON_ID=181622 /ORGANISM="Strombidinopsis sp, Strain SopsisLIS2011" /LENGTH=53 /DNA_ID=CAMNT_0004525431 /DNA_START=522 /DNA_END=683 /DNA_ORIENTATION=+